VFILSFRNLCSFYILSVNVLLSPTDNTEQENVIPQSICVNDKNDGELMDSLYFVHICHYNFNYLFDSIT